MIKWLMNQDNSVIVNIIIAVLEELNEDELDLISENIQIIKHRNFESEDEI